MGADRSESPSNEADEHVDAGGEYDLSDEEAGRESVTYIDLGKAKSLDPEVWGLLARAEVGTGSYYEFHSLQSLGRQKRPRFGGQPSQARPLVYLPGVAVHGPEGEKPLAAGRDTWTPWRSTASPDGARPASQGGSSSDWSGRSRLQVAAHAPRAARWRAAVARTRRLDRVEIPALAQVDNAAAAAQLLEEEVRGGMARRSGRRLRPTSPENMLRLDDGNSSQLHALDDLRVEKRLPTRGAKKDWNRNSSRVAEVFSAQEQPDRAAGAKSELWAPWLLHYEKESCTSSGSAFRSAEKASARRCHHCRSWDGFI
ncbi:unnamed protein product [Effrenium voratum]|nr:unnamed protein product [Effrenium voratum]